MSVSVRSNQTVTRRPGMLAFRRGVEISDASFYEKDAIDGTEKPVFVLSHGFRGAASNDTSSKKGTATGGAVDPRHVNMTETARLSPASSGFVARFGMKMLPLKEALDTCIGTKPSASANAQVIRQSFTDFIERAGEDRTGIDEVSRRIARNVLNGRWLWRNLSIASAVKVQVYAMGLRGEKGDLIASVDDALALPRDHFRDFTHDEIQLGDQIASGMLGETRLCGVVVEANVDIGVPGGVEVFCSQNYVARPKSSGNEENAPRSLYKLPLDDAPDGVVGHAAFRDAKVWAALRTIDTWYGDEAEEFGPIAVEPLGASLAHVRFFRDKKNNSALDIVRRLNIVDPAEPDGMYFLAALMRGGVYGEKEKEEKNPTSPQKGSGRGQGEAQSETGDDADGLPLPEQQAA